MPSAAAYFPEIDLDLPVLGGKAFQVCRAEPTGTGYVRAAVALLDGDASPEPPREILLDDPVEIGNVAREMRLDLPRLLKFAEGLRVMLGLPQALPGYVVEAGNATPQALAAERRAREAAEARARHLERQLARGEAERAPRLEAMQRELDEVKCEAVLLKRCLDHQDGPILYALVDVVSDSIRSGHCVQPGDTGKVHGRCYKTAVAERAHRAPSTVGRKIAQLVEAGIIEDDPQEETIRLVARDGRPIERKQEISHLYLPGMEHGREAALLHLLDAPTAVKHGGRRDAKPEPPRCEEHPDTGHYTERERHERDRCTDCGEQIGEPRVVKLPTLFYDAEGERIPAPTQLHLARNRVRGIGLHHATRWEAGEDLDAPSSPRTSSDGECAALDCRNLAIEDGYCYAHAPAALARALERWSDDGTLAAAAQLLAEAGCAAEVADVPARATVLLEAYRRAREGPDRPRAGTSLTGEDIDPLGPVRVQLADLHRQVLVSLPRVASGSEPTRGTAWPSVAD